MADPSYPALLLPGRSGAGVHTADISQHPATDIPGPSITLSRYIIRPSPIIFLDKLNFSPVTTSSALCSTNLRPALSSKQCSIPAPPALPECMSRVINKQPAGCSSSTSLGSRPEHLRKHWNLQKRNFIGLKWTQYLGSILQKLKSFSFHGKFNVAEIVGAGPGPAARLTAEVDKCHIS